MKTLIDSIRELERAARRLETEQGRIARRNARHAVLNALAAARQQLDRDYPAIKPPPKERKVRTLAQRRRELISEGWVVVLNHGAGLMSFVAEQKLPTRSTPMGELDRTVRLPGGAVKGAIAPAETWIPGWVAHYYFTGNKTLINQARHTPQMIQAAKAAVRLGSLDQAIKDKIIVIPKE